MDLKTCNYTRIQNNQFNLSHQNNKDLKQRTLQTLIQTRNTELWSEQYQTKIKNAQKLNKTPIKLELKKEVKLYPKKQCPKCLQDFVFKQKPYNKLKENQKPVIIWQCYKCERYFDLKFSNMQCKCTQDRTNLCIQCFKKPTESTQKQIFENWKLKRIKQEKCKAKKECSYKMCWSKTGNQGFTCENCIKVLIKLEKEIELKQLEQDLKKLNMDISNQKKKDDINLNKKILQLEIKIHELKYKEFPKYPKTKEQIQEKELLLQQIINFKKQLEPIDCVLKIEKMKRQISQLRKEKTKNKYLQYEKIIKLEIEIINQQLIIYDEISEEKDKLFHVLFVKKIHLKLINEQRILDSVFLEKQAKKEKDKYVEIKIEKEIFDLLLYLYKDNQYYKNQTQKYIDKLEQKSNKYKNKYLEENGQDNKVLVQFHLIEFDIIDIEAEIQIYQLRLRYLHDQEEDNKTNQLIKQDIEKLKELNLNYANVKKELEKQRKQKIYQNLKKKDFVKLRQNYVKYLQGNKIGEYKQQNEQNILQYGQNQSEESQIIQDEENQNQNSSEQQSQVDSEWQIKSQNSLNEDQNNNNNSQEIQQSQFSNNNQSKQSQISLGMDKSDIQNDNKDSLSQNEQNNQSYVPKEFTQIDIENDNDSENEKQNNNSSQFKSQSGSLNQNISISQSQNYKEDLNEKQNISNSQKQLNNNSELAQSFSQKSVNQLINSDIDDSYEEEEEEEEEVEEEQLDSQNSKQDKSQSDKQIPNDHTNSKSKSLTQSQNQNTYINQQQDQQSSISNSKIEQEIQSSESFNSSKNSQKQNFPQLSDHMKQLLKELSSSSSGSKRSSISSENSKNIKNSNKSKSDSDEYYDDDFEK